MLTAPTSRYSGIDADMAQYLLKRDRAMIALLYLAALRVSELLSLKLGQFKPDPLHVHGDGEDRRADPRIIAEAIVVLKKARAKHPEDKVRDAYLPMTGERAPLTGLVTEYLAAAAPPNYYLPPEAVKVIPLDYWQAERPPLEPEADRFLFPSPNLKRKVNCRDVQRAVVDPDTKKIVDYEVVLPKGATIFGVGQVRPLDRRRAYGIVREMTGGWNHFFRSAGERYLYRKWAYDSSGVASYVKVSADVLQQYLKDEHEAHPTV